MRAIDILFVCTGNICRSPMAAALLGRYLGGAGVEATVHSAGVLHDGVPATDHGVAVMAARGVDTSGHRSRRLTGAMVKGADLVVGLAREHVRAAVDACPEAWPKVFTLKEVVRRGEAAGGAGPGGSLTGWIEGLHTGRHPSDLLGASAADDVEDPFGMRRRHYEHTADELDDLTGRLARLLSP